jgi:hypothetical protein
VEETIMSTKTFCIQMSDGSTAYFKASSQKEAEKYASAEYGSDANSAPVEVDWATHRGHILDAFMRATGQKFPVQH